MTQAPGTPRDQPPRGPAKLEQWQQMPPEPGDPNSVQSSSTYHSIEAYSGAVAAVEVATVAAEVAEVAAEVAEVATVAAAVAEVAAAVARWQRQRQWQGGKEATVARWQGGKVARRLRWHRRWLR
ncbi:hypothetical protein L3X38_023118 [Prunus dulcis]|uniref:Uncharacterized protein n=1 Tax=Prunus dulcis TaxID=3755 RepID=A0AAD4VYX0_PRUDU|nr:hypothetical protein L3X38_023118 [Prunus dulcis]